MAKRKVDYSAFVQQTLSPSEAAELLELYEALAPVCTPGNAAFLRALAGDLRRQLRALAWPLDAAKAPFPV